MSFVLGRGSGSGGGGGGAPSGPAGGDLAGTYPDPTLAAGTVLFNAYAILSEVQAVNTSGGTFTSGAWLTRVLNTEVDPSGFVTLASNQFELGAGSYYLDAVAPCYLVNANKLRIQNITDTVTEIIGQNQQTQAGTAAGAEPAHLRGRMTVVGTKTFELQHICQTTRADDGFGEVTNLGVDEVYSTVTIFREA